MHLVCRLPFAGNGTFRYAVLAATLWMAIPMKAQPARQSAKTTVATAANNPLLAKWTAPFGAPPFDKIKPGHFLPAFRTAMARHKREVAAIAAQRSAPNFTNTIAAMEKAGQDLTKVVTVFSNLNTTDTNDELQKIELEISPKLTAHLNQIAANSQLFARVQKVYDTRESAGLDPEQIRLVERIYTGFVRGGAKLNAAGKKRFAQIDERLSVLGAQFGQNMLADTKEFILVLETKEDLAGLPSFVVEAAAEEAKSRGMKGAYVITISRSSVEPFLTFSSRRDLREKAFKAWMMRGDNDNKFDNKKIIEETIQLRVERSKLLGYQNYAEYAISDSMAKTPKAALELMDRVWKPARAKALEERDLLQAMMSKEGVAGKLEPWDWRYYAEKVRKAQYDLDETEVKPYFQLDKMIEASFYTANRLFGLTFHERKDIPMYHPDVRVWEIKNAKGEHVALFWGDYFARPSKQSGAWMNSYRDQQKLIGNITPIVANHCNFNKAADGKPVLLSYDDAETLFHEFGHALHGLLSNVTYPTLSGTNVPRDFVELPSQIYEHWLGTEEILSKFAVHYQTGQPMPKQLIEKVRRARTFNQGFSTVEFLASAFVDMDYHLIEDPKTKINVRDFEKQSLLRREMPDEIVMRHRSTHFSHIFGGPGYSAGYYSYMWAEVLDADGFEAFKEAGNVFNPEVSKRLLENIYSIGNTKDLMKAYVGFRGQEPKVEPLLKNRGLQ